MSKISTGLVSTIIPVHNRADLLKEAVASVLAQTYQHVEVIIVDDGSTDDTAAVADQVQNENPSQVKVIHKENSGPGPSRERGLELANGEFIQFLDSDDLLDKNKFTSQVLPLQEDNEAAICYGITQYYRLGEEGKQSVFAETNQSFDSIFPAFLVRRRWGTSSPVYRRAVLDLIGPWGDMWSEEDWEYDCRIGTLSKKVIHVDLVGSYQRGLVGQRLSQRGRNDKKTLRSQAKARKLIYSHALLAGISSRATEAEIFSRKLFFLARDCGGAGLYGEAKELVDIAQSFNNNERLTKQIRLYKALSTLWGWKTSAWLSRLTERSKLLEAS